VGVGDVPCRSMDQRIGSGDQDVDIGVSRFARRCSRPLCSRVADVVLLFDYGASHVVLDRSSPDHDPNHLELCFEHAETFSPPRGWTLEDRRAHLVAVMGSVGSVAGGVSG